MRTHHYPVKNCRFPAGIMLYLLLAACTSNAQPVLDLVYQADRCGGLEPGIHRLQSQQALEEIVRSRGVISLDGNNGGTPRPDFDGRHVLAISEGVRNTSGYDITLTGGIAAGTNGTVVLPVEFSTPENEIVAQVITSPCIVVALERGDYQRIEAGDYSLMLDE